MNERTTTTAAVVTITTTNLGLFCNTVIFVIGLHLIIQDNKRIVSLLACDKKKLQSFYLTLYRCSMFVRY